MKWIGFFALSGAVVATLIHTSSGSIQTPVGTITPDPAPEIRTWPLLARHEGRLFEPDQSPHRPREVWLLEMGGGLHQFDQDGRLTRQTTFRWSEPMARPYVAKDGSIVAIGIHSDDVRVKHPTDRIGRPVHRPSSTIRQLTLSEDGQWLVWRHTDGPLHPREAPRFLIQSLDGTEVKEVDLRGRYPSLDSKLAGMRCVAYDPARGELDLGYADLRTRAVVGLDAGLRSGPLDIPHEPRRAILPSYRDFNHTVMRPPLDRDEGPRTVTWTLPAGKGSFTLPAGYSEGEMDLDPSGRWLAIAVRVGHPFSKIQERHVPRMAELESSLVVLSTGTGEVVQRLRYPVHTNLRPHFLGSKALACSIEGRGLPEVHVVALP